MQILGSNATRRARPKVRRGMRESKNNGWEEGKKKETRPDTRPTVADGWAGAEMRVFTLSNSIITDQRTNGQTKPRIELRVRN